MEVECIMCYQCNSTDLQDPFQCQEFLGDDIDIQPTSCDEVYGAAYCIKHTGRFEVNAIYCYQCFAPNDTDCTDVMISEREGSRVLPASCDHIFEARYCIKSTGEYAGGVGTRRYCSSVDMGNYCNYIKQPGDEREYRSCTFTCSTDGCNAGIVKQLSFALFVTAILSFLLFS
ncbi:glycosylphosphatidylinositol anchored membrane protein boudin isoform X2 [Rhodnius prolixus]|uniref:glycosylphosphatidylinositol anchored membrane protein boudin isoform X2 n=1 Tax=Rhodnius prolixus TaxID=13249 RepID=UPI003D188618